MKTQLGRIVILVKDYDEAFEFYEKNLGCKKFFDLTDDNGQRFLHISFDSESPTGIWFIKAETDEQKKCIGRQTAGMPVFVLYTDSFDEFVNRLIVNNITILREAEESNDSVSLSFLDLYGNEIVLVQLNKDS